jgi:predicted transcriptional regulator
MYDYDFEKRDLRFLKRRGKLEIYLDILFSIYKLAGRGWAKITRVMYMTNLNPKSLKEKLQELSYLDLIIWDERGVKLTEKGFSFLKEINTIFEKYKVHPIWHTKVYD